MVFKKWIENSYEKERIKIDTEKKHQKSLLEVEKTKEKVLKRKAENKESEKDLWEREYLLLKNNNQLKTAFNQAQKAIYSNYGQTHGMVGNLEKAFLDLKWLCTIGKDNYWSEVISFTTKWKYFMDRYLEDNIK